MPKNGMSAWNASIAMISGLQRLAFTLTRRGSTALIGRPRTLFVRVFLPKAEQKVKMRLQCEQNKYINEHQNNNRHPVCRAIKNLVSQNPVD
jgi:hypothetical protein